MNRSPLFLFFKAQIADSGATGDLFAQPVRVSGYTTSHGAYVAPYEANRSVSHGQGDGGGHRDLLGGGVAPLKVSKPDFLGRMLVEGQKAIGGAVWKVALVHIPERDYGAMGKVPARLDRTLVWHRGAETEDDPHWNALEAWPAYDHNNSHYNGLPATLVKWAVSLGARALEQVKTGG